MYGELKGIDQEGEKIMGRPRAIHFLLMLILSLLPAIAFTAPGDLDTAFNAPNGFVLFNGSGNNRDRGIELAIQADGKIVVMGYSNNGKDDDIMVLRYNPDGTMDNTFGSGGVVYYGGSGGGSDRGLGLALQSDGKIVVVGRVYNGTNYDVIVLRYSSDGTVDNTFGAGGVVTYNGPENGSDIAFGVAIQSDGKLVVVGESYYGTNKELLILRYNPDGSLDSSFGTGGVVIYGGPNQATDWGFGVDIQSDGKIVVVGATTVNTKEDVLVLRYNTDGTLDGSFGTGGIVTYSGSGDNYDYGNTVMIQPDGKIVVVGATWIGSNYDILVLRYNSNGSLDCLFGNGGVINYNGPANNYDYAWGVALQKDGKIVVAGASSNGAKDEAAILRFNTNGTFDPSFGTAGVVKFSVPGSAVNRGYGVVIQKDGKIVVSGYSSDGTNDDVLVLRLLGNQVRSWANESVLFDLKIIEPFKDDSGNIILKETHGRFAGEVVLECVEDENCTARFTATSQAFFDFPSVVDLGTDIPEKRIEEWILVGTGSFVTRGVAASPGIAYLDAKAKFNKATEVITLSGEIVAGHRTEYSTTLIRGHFSNIKLHPVP
jgi:uncharacterized delta-60 repeat protein